MFAYLIFLLAFIPLFIYSQFKITVDKPRLKMLKAILGIASSVILGLAGMLKIMELQEAHLFLMVGIIIFAAGFLPIYIFTMYRKSLA